MGNDTIKMNYYLMESMAGEFKNTAQVLEEILAKVKDISGQIENGALQGKAGDALHDVLQNKMATNIGKMKERFEDLEKDLREAVHQMQNADEISGGYYKD